MTITVLQTEAGFVSLCHLGAIDRQQVIVGKDVHTVIMPTRAHRHRHETFFLCAKGSKNLTQPPILQTHTARFTSDSDLRGVTYLN